MVTTRHSFEHHVIEEEFGVISCCDVRSVNIFKDLAAAIVSVLDGPSPFYGKLVSDSSAAALDKMIAKAKEQGANGELLHHRHRSERRRS